jgi:hypothetical protein
MPSKGGRRSAGVAATPGAAPLQAGSAPIAAIANPHVLSRLQEPLRRGTEVNRFNDLARREEELGREELEELYGYRLRRLAARLRRLGRVAAGVDEEQLRQGLEDYLARLQDVRRLENRLGLDGSPDQVDLGGEQVAIARLVDLASQRLHGLIAGSGDEPQQSAGSARIAEVAFAPSDVDREIYVLAPESLPAEALARNVQAVAGEGARLHLIRDAAEIPRDGEPPLVLNWGGSDELPAGLVALNRPAAVRTSSDQVESLHRLAELAPRTVLNPEDLGLLGSDQVVAKRRQGARGSGKAVLGSDSAPGQLAGYDLYQEFIPERREYRISVLSGRVVSAYLKRAAEGSAPADLRPEWSFERLQSLPRAALETAREGAHRIGLDYAGVDIVEDLRSGRFYCLEANAAPGMSEETLRGLYAQVQQSLRGRLRRAS